MVNKVHKQVWSIITAPNFEITSRLCINRSFLLSAIILVVPRTIFDPNVVNTFHLIDVSSDGVLEIKLLAVSWTVMFASHLMW